MTGIFKINNNEVFGSDGTFSGTIGNSAIFPGEHHVYTSGYLNSWATFNWSTSYTHEDGIRVYRMGNIYMIHFSIQKNTTVGSVEEVVLNLGSNITHPTNTVHLGQSIYSNQSATEHEYYIGSSIETNGDIKIRGYNGTGTNFLVITSMMGMDIA